MWFSTAFSVSLWLFSLGLTFSVHPPPTHTHTPQPLLHSAIFYTIRKYGPIVFTVIMTTRQMLSIVLSTILFGHTMGAESIVGALVVFLAVFHSIHRQVKESKEKKASKDAPPADGESKSGKEVELASGKK